jgi:peroxiredoxin
MPRTVALLVATAVVVVAASAGIYAAARPSATPSSAVAIDAGPAPAPVAGAAADRAAGPRHRSRPRAGRVLPLAEAMTALDLIRPSRAKRADDFTVETTGGRPFRLGEHRGSVVLLNFWATWCPPCLAEMPAFEALHRQHKDAGLVVVAVSLDTDPAKVPPFVKEHGLTFPIGLDPRSRVAEQYAIRALPSTFVIDAEGHLAALALGPRAWAGDAAHSLVEALVR